MDQVYADNADEVRTIFQTYSPNRGSWDLVRDRERAKRIQLLRLPDLEGESAAKEIKKRIMAHQTW